MNNTSQLQRWNKIFGKEYTDRNKYTVSQLDKMYKKTYGITRTELNSQFIGKLDREIKILEIGSNIGNQLLVLQKMGFKNLFGLEPLEYAVELSKKRLIGINIIRGSAFDIPFKDIYFDLVFSSGVLIHINPKDIRKAMKEIYRCTNKYIWGFEYFSEKYQEVNYRGEKNLLWKADFPRLYIQNFSDLKLIKVKYIKYLQDKNIDEMFILKK